jgi:hypothetical protein
LIAAADRDGKCHIPLFIAVFFHEFITNIPASHKGASRKFQILTE